MNKEEIWDLYYYSDAEIKWYLYLTNLYFFLIQRKKHTILNSRQKLNRFALISLFPLYRACNHQGIGLNSNDYDNYYSPEKERLKSIELVIGEKIRDTNHYLTLTGLKTSWLIWIPLIPRSLKFYFLVMNDRD